MKSNFIVMASIFMLMPSLSLSASFDCSKASTKVENMICSDSHLSILDETLASKYKILRSSLTIEEQGEVIKEQRLWLQERNASCVNAKECQRVYSSRIKELKDWHKGIERLTTYGLYEKFNMRSIFSSFGQRLKYYCQSYPKDFFMVTNISENKLELEADDDVWEFTIEEPNIIYINNTITSGTYNSSVRYEIYYVEKNNDWRSRETFIDISEDCKQYN